MPRRIANETNPYLIPVYVSTRHPSYKPPAAHAAARALMQVVGDVELLVEQHLVALVVADKKQLATKHTKMRKPRLIEGASYKNEEEEEEEEDTRRVSENDDDDDDEEAEKDHRSAHGAAEHTKEDDERNDKRVMSPMLKRLRQARNFAELHRKMCTECKFEHYSKLEGEQEKLLVAERASRDSMYAAQDAARKAVRDEYNLTHIRIRRYLEATRKERERALRLAERQRTQRMFDANEQAARNVVMAAIFAERAQLFSTGALETMDFITIEQRVIRKDAERLQRAERHIVNIASHMRAEKMRKIESSMFVIVGAEPNARRLVEAEATRGVQRLVHWNAEALEQVENLILNKRLAAQMQERQQLDKDESEARFKQVVSLEVRERDYVHQAKLQDRARLLTEQLLVKRSVLLLTETAMRKQVERVAAAQMAAVLLRMISMMEASARYFVRVQAHEATASLAASYNVDFQCA